MDKNSSHEMNDQSRFDRQRLEDAKISGYTDEQGKAVSMARPDVVGSPTGAYTDIGAGRSSAVRPASEEKTNEEDAPDIGEEQAP